MRIAYALMGVLVLGAAVAAAISISAGETPRKVRIVYTNDLTGYLEPCG